MYKHSISHVTVEEFVLKQTLIKILCASNGRNVYRKGCVRAVWCSSQGSRLREKLIYSPGTRPDHDARLKVTGYTLPVARSSRAVTATWRWARTINKIIIIIHVYCSNKFLFLVSRENHGFHSQTTFGLSMLTICLLMYNVCKSRKHK
jgi:hypothetical protein